MMVPVSMADQFNKHTPTEHVLYIYMYMHMQLVERNMAVFGEYVLVHMYLCIYVISTENGAYW